MVGSLTGSPSDPFLGCPRWVMYHAACLWIGDGWLCGVGEWVGK